MVSIPTKSIPTNSIPTNLNYFLISIAAFSIVYWWQSVDDQKRKKERIDIYDKIKLPLLVSAIIGCILLWNNNSITNSISTNYNKEISTNYNKEISPNFFTDLKIQPENNIMNMKPSIISSKQPEVYTDLLEW